MNKGFCTGCRLLILLFLAGMFLMGITEAQSGITDVSCFHCHSGQVNEFETSVHYNRGISCTDCHGGDINISGSIISINVMHTNFTVLSRENSTNSCSNCHPKETEQYRNSIHWKELQRGVTIAATCTDCHGVHNILPSSNNHSLTYTDNIPQTCANCHQNQTKMQAWYYEIRTDMFDTYKKSFHYKALLSGGKGLATCPDCHENHDTRSQSDPASTINPANLPATCGKTGCHPGQNVLITGGKVHEGQSIYLWFIDAKKLVTYFYIIMIIFEITFTLGLIFLGITSKFELRRRE
jgi:hypothetical protein